MNISIMNHTTVFAKPEKFYRWGLLLLLAIFAAEIIYVTSGGYLYGGKVDWITQHVEIPSYLRDLFYSTGKFFPDFAANLGGGQNIYYLAYYGLFSPVVLVSYLLPFVSMQAYMTGAAVVLTALSIILIWRWLAQHLPYRAAFAGALLFTLAAPVMYHSHHHLMFVNYLPFMILAMEGVEKYIREKKSLQMVLSVILIILSSYFFSVGAILCLCLYGIYLYLGQEKESRGGLKAFSVQAGGFVGLLVTAVLVTAVLWLPVLHVILAGRADTTTSVTLTDLLVPQLQDRSFFYRTSGMGLSAVFLLCIAGCLTVRTESKKRFAGIVFLIFLFFGLPVYVMNGGMYVNGKVLIPFLPFAALLLGSFLEDTVRRRYSLAHFLPVTAVLIVLALLTWQGKKSMRDFFIGDLILSLVVVLLLYCVPKKREGHPALRILAIIVLFLPAFNNCFTVNGEDALVRADENPRTVYAEDTAALLQAAKARNAGHGLVRTDLLYEPKMTANYVLDPDQLRSGIYSSLNNQYYHNYYFKDAGNEIDGPSNASIKPVKNPLYSLRMGVRYMIGSRDRVPVSGWKKVACSGELALYENKAVLPIGYVSSTSVSFRPHATRISAQPLAESLASLKNVDRRGNTLYFRRRKAGKVRVALPPSSKKQVVQITMHVDNSSYRKKGSISREKGMVEMQINGVKNVLSSPNWKYANGNSTFHFTLLLKPGTDHLTVLAGHGRYTVSGITVKTWPYSQYKKWHRSVSPWHLRIKSDNVLTGTIRSEKDTQMQISVPYDEGFTVYADGKKTAYRKTEEGFLSIPLKKGSHRVTLRFDAPGKKEGMAGSAAGIVLLAAEEIGRRALRNRQRRHGRGAEQI